MERPLKTRMEEGNKMSFLKMLSRRFMAFMSTRNGFDQLSMAILIGSLLLQIIGSVTGLNVILFLSIALYGWALFRVFSKRNPKRAAENQKFLAWWTPIGPYDMMIAAQAITRSNTLITHNTDEFLRVSQLAVEDWTV